MKTNAFTLRRNKLAEKFSRTLFVISCGEESKRSHSVGYRFKAASDFSYLTGVELNNAILIIAGKSKYLLSATFSAEAALWDDEGELSASDKENLQGVQFESLDRLEDILISHLAYFDRLAFAVGRSSSVDHRLLSLISFNRRIRSRQTALPVSLCDSRTLVGALRIKKDETEIALMKEAGKRSSLVHNRLMSQSFVGRSERDICNWIEAQFMLEGMQWTAYQTIVGAGERSTLLHARATDRIIKNDELILIDAGGEWKGYCADITRTLISGKKFTAEQKNLYRIVLEAQKTVINAAQVGTTLQELHRLSLAVLSEGLLKLGYAKDLLATDIKKLIPHSTSHWIGLDVHDPSSYFDDAGAEIKLETGMCFTIEPGLYVREDIQGFAGYQGLGVRIEDDILITETGHELLTSVAKEIEEIEGLRG